MSHAILLISCDDRKGVTAAVTEFVFCNNGNILHAEQHTDENERAFFMRIEWELEGFLIGDENIEEAFLPIAEKFGMKWDLFLTGRTPRVSLFVSRRLHCLYDLLLRYKAGQFACTITSIISNHPEAGEAAGDFGIKFSEFPITPENKIDQEKKEIELLEKENVDLIVLARYHQILSPDFVSRFRDRIINIHHSFLPAFPGEKPYLRAYKKGVKLIGATSHYVTEELDEGPIIEQDTVRISHKNSAADLVRIGEDLEKMVLSRAVRSHLARKVLSYNNKTVVFD